MMYRLNFDMEDDDRSERLSVLFDLYPKHLAQVAVENFWSYKLV